MALYPTSPIARVKNLKPFLFSSHNAAVATIHDRPDPVSYSVLSAPYAPAAQAAYPHLLYSHSFIPHWQTFQ